MIIIRFIPVVGGAAIEAHFNNNVMAKEYFQEVRKIRKDNTEDNINMPFAIQDDFNSHISLNLFNYTVMYFDLEEGIGAEKQYKEEYDKFNESGKLGIGQ